MSEDVNALRAEIAEKHQWAQDLSAEKDRLVKELGKTRKRALEADELEASVSDLKAALAEADSKVSALTAALQNANDRLKRADQVLAAASAVSDGLATLEKLSR